MSAIKLPETFIPRANGAATNWCAPMLSLLEAARKEAGA